MLSGTSSSMSVLETHTPGGELRQNCEGERGRETEKQCMFYTCKYKFMSGSCMNAKEQ